LVLPYIFILFKFVLAFNEMSINFNAVVDYFEVGYFYYKSFILFLYYFSAYYNGFYLHLLKIDF